MSDWRELSKNALRWTDERIAGEALLHRVGPEVLKYSSDRMGCSLESDLSLSGVTIVDVLQPASDQSWPLRDHDDIHWVLGETIDGVSESWTKPEYAWYPLYLAMLLLRLEHRNGVRGGIPKVSLCIGIICRFAAMRADPSLTANASVWIFSLLQERLAGRFATGEPEHTEALTAGSALLARLWGGQILTGGTRQLWPPWMLNPSHLNNGSETVWKDALLAEGELSLKVMEWESSNRA